VLAKQTRCKDVVRANGSDGHQSLGVTALGFAEQMSEFARLIATVHARDLTIVLDPQFTGGIARKPPNRTRYV
jgi:hypothetical protein